MYWLTLKRGFVELLIGTNLVLLIWAIRVYRQKVALPPTFLRLMAVSSFVVLALVGVGLTLLLKGWQAELMHIFYGVLVSLGASAQFLLSGRTALAQRYRGKPLVFAFSALFVALLAARSWMAA